MNATPRSLRSPSHHRIPQPDSTHPCGEARAHRLTVGSMPAPWPAYTPRPDPLPYLRLRDRWLQEAGFAVGARIRVRIEPQRLILEVENDRPSDSRVRSATVQEPRVLP